MCEILQDTKKEIEHKANEINSSANKTGISNEPIINKKYKVTLTENLDKTDRVWKKNEEKTPKKQTKSLLKQLQW